MITAQIASLPERVGHLRITVDSLIPQVDMIFVALNGYEDIPEFLCGHQNIVPILMDNKYGDAAKFYDIDSRKGYVLTCDDDLVYSPNYADYMTSKVDEYKGAVSLMGRRYGERPIRSFRKGYTKSYGCLSHVDGDYPVDMVGTGVLAFHTDHIKITMEDFIKRRNMADVWFSKLAHEQGVPLMVVAHKPYFVQHKHFPWRIWSNDFDDNYQTEVINSFLK